MLARLLRALVGAMALIGLVLLLCFVAGRVLTDLFHWSQFLWWIPAWVLLLCATLLTLPRALVPVRRPTPAPYAEEPTAPPRTRRRRPWPLGDLVAAPLVLSLLGWVLLLPTFHLHRGLRGRAPAAFTIAHWNAMAPMNLTPTMFAPFATPDTEPPLDVLCWSAAMSRDQAKSIVQSSLGPGYEVDGRGIFYVASRHKIIRLTTLNLGLQGPLAARPAEGDDARVFPVTASESRSTLEYLYNTYGPSVGLPRRVFRNADPGHLIVIELDTTALRGCTTVVYAFDLPSDPLRSKLALAERVVAELDSARAQGAWLPDPDIAIGDFNIPRSSRSLSVLLPGLRDGFHEAGWGLAATWPYAHPLIAIDHAFVGPGLSAQAFDTIDPRMSDHLGIRLGVNFLNK